MQASWLHKRPGSWGERIGCLLAVTFLSACLGCLGGGIIAGPFFPFGMVVGPFYSAPVGLAIGTIAGVARFPGKLVLAVCGLQFAGALSAGAGAWLYDADPVNLANLGQLAGAAAGLLLASVIVCCMPPPLLPGRCRNCRYDLHGLSEPRCPECGTPFDPGASP